MKKLLLFLCVMAQIMPFFVSKVIANVDFMDKPIFVNLKVNSDDTTIRKRLIRYLKGELKYADRKIVSNYDDDYGEPWNKNKYGIRESISLVCIVIDQGINLACSSSFFGTDSDINISADTFHKLGISIRPVAELNNLAETIIIEFEELINNHIISHKKWIQTKLGIKNDGIFGKHTRTCIKKHQAFFKEKHPLWPIEISGYADFWTIESLRDIVIDNGKNKRYFEYNLIKWKCE